MLAVCRNGSQSHGTLPLIRKPELETATAQIGDTKLTDFAGAERLANEDKYQFQYWALGLVGARPIEQKKGADGGIDGRLYFHDDDSGKSRQIIFSVKGGGVTVAQVRDLRGVIERDKAEIGVFLCFEQPTRPMLKEAAEAGFYKSSDGTSYPRLQILTIEQLLNGQQLQYHSIAGTPPLGRHLAAAPQPQAI